MILLKDIDILLRRVLCDYKDLVKNAVKDWKEYFGEPRLEKGWVVLPMLVKIKNQKNGIVIFARINKILCENFWAHPTYHIKTLHKNPGQFLIPISGIARYIEKRL